MSNSITEQTTTRGRKAATGTMKRRPLTALLALGGTVLTANAQSQDWDLLAAVGTKLQSPVHLIEQPTTLPADRGGSPDDTVTISMRSGQCDCFLAPQESTLLRGPLVQVITDTIQGPIPGLANFDETDQDEFFLHSFVGLPKGCIIGGTLTITARPLGSLAYNDGMALGQAEPGATLADDFARWSYGDRTSNPPTLFPGTSWDISTRPDECGYTAVIDLNTLVGNGTGTETLIDRMNTLGVLDVFSSDDTAIDCVVLELQVEPGCVPSCDNEPDPDPCLADTNSDGTLDVFDFLTFLNAFSAGCP